MSEQNNAFPTYKGKPLVRCGDTIYYGDMRDPYVTKLDIKSKKNVNGLEVADKVVVRLMATDPNISPNKMIERTGERQGLYEALDMADYWLTKKLTEVKKG
jgi:hypothetical protein